MSNTVNISMSAQVHSGVWSMQKYSTKTCGSTVTVSRLIVDLAGRADRFILQTWVSLRVRACLVCGGRLGRVLLKITGKSFVEVHL